MMRARTPCGRGRARGAALVAALVAGALAGPARSAEPPRPTLTVFAAASLTEPFRELARMLEAARPGLAVRCNFAGSQQLAAQLEQGARADVFAPADERWMVYVAGRDLIAGEPRVFAHNTLVAIVPRTDPARVRTLQGLARRGVKLVVGAPSVPVGAYGRELLARLARAPGFPADYARRVLANVVSEEENVKSVVAKVQLAEADAGLVYRSDVTGSAARHVRVLPIPESAHVLARYPIARLRGAPNDAAAAAFLELLASPAGGRVLERHGLIPAPATGP